MLGIEELERFGRQLSILGSTKHNKLRNSKVLVVGCGGLGNTCIPYLYHCGMTIGVSDDDIVDISNIHRQYMHTTHVGSKKSESMKAQCPNLIVEPHFTLESSRMTERYDIVVDCCDNPGTKYLINESCILYNKPWVSASAVAQQGQLLSFNKDTPCYRCINPHLPPIISSCDDMGVVGPCPGTFGCLQAYEVINVILNQSLMRNIMLYIQFDKWEFKKIKLRHKNPECGSCGIKKTQMDLTVCKTEQQGISYDKFMSIKDSSLVVDVRSVEKFSVYNINDSINIPITNIMFNPSQAKSKILASMNDKSNIVFICRRGNDSQIAHSKLNFELPSFNLVGGYMMVCKEANYL